MEFRTILGAVDNRSGKCKIEDEGTIKQAVAEFKELRGKFVSVFEQYENAYRSFLENVEKDTHHKKYAKGGETIHRGFYSSSLADLVIAGANRGNLLKRMQKNSTYDYEYFFDENGTMICCKNYSDNIATAEFFVYREDSILSLTYNATPGMWTGRLDEITRSFYSEGNLIRYEEASCYRYEATICADLITTEDAEYIEGKLQSLCLSNFVSPSTVSQTKFTFSCDEEGLLSTYSSKELNKPPSLTDDLVLDVLGKRKSRGFFTNQDGRFVCIQKTI